MKHKTTDLSSAHEEHGANTEIFHADPEAHSWSKAHWKTDTKTRNSTKILGKTDDFQPLRDTAHTPKSHTRLRHGWLGECDVLAPLAFKA